MYLGVLGQKVGIARYLGINSTKTDVDTFIGGLRKWRTPSHTIATVNFIR